jgi:hypothetical protein
VSAVMNLRVIAPRSELVYTQPLNNLIQSTMSVPHFSLPCNMHAIDVRVLCIIEQISSTENYRMNMTWVL